MVSWPGSMIPIQGVIRVEANSYYKKIQSFVSGEAFLFHFLSEF
jgi:hypothetical protein